jgi:murein DD-endopeptidase MepM/ murein hydrolase activator NlpD
MQLIWLSGPTGKMVSLSITTRTVLLGCAAAAALLVLIGVALHFVGLRIAVAYSPTVAQQLGGVTSVRESRLIEESYRTEVSGLEQRLGHLVQRVRELELSKTQLNELLGIRQLVGPQDKSLRRAAPAIPGSSWFGSGGPLNPTQLGHSLRHGLSIQTPALASELSSLARQWDEIDQSWLQLQQQWQAESQRLIGLPVGLPLLGEFFISSGYGVRTDPLRGTPSLHEGLDFVAPPGTPVLATAPGVVSRSESSGDYGQWVEVSHGEQFKTRYAHLRQRLVAVGQQVARGQAIGEVGSTGRSTGPHLHYEVEHQGRIIDPTKTLAKVALR